MIERRNFYRILHAQPDASNLQAIAEITHTSAERNGTSVGARFITVKFDQIRGNFISAKA